LTKSAPAVRADELLKPVDVASRLHRSQAWVYMHLDDLDAIDTDNGWRIPLAAVEAEERARAIVATTPDEVYAAWAVKAREDFQRRTGLKQVPRAVLVRCAEAIRTVPADDAA
jgi:hypothetical protein